MTLHLGLIKVLAGGRVRTTRDGADMVSTNVAGAPAGGPNLKFGSKAVRGGGRSGLVNRAAAPGYAEGSARLPFATATCAVPGLQYAHLALITSQDRQAARPHPPHAHHCSRPVCLLPNTLKALNLTMAATAGASRPATSARAAMCRCTGLLGARGASATSA